MGPTHSCGPRVSRTRPRESRVTRETRVSVNASLSLSLSLDGILSRERFELIYALLLLLVVVVVVRGARD